MPGQASSHIPTLVTPRLVLRPFVTDDLDALVPIHAEASFWWYPRRAAMGVTETAEFLARMLARYESDGFGIEALLDRESGAMIGWGGLAVPHFLPEILPAVEVGWRLSEPWRGRGLATEAGAAAVDFGFGSAGLERIVSIYEPENVASGRVMEHLGFAPWLRTNGPSGEEVLVMELDRADWVARQAGG